MKVLDANNVKGLWAALPTPWTTGGKLDEGTLQRNCEKLAEAGVDGIYTTDSDGEFYAIEQREFGRIAKIFGKAMERLKLPGQMGVTWSHTKGIVDRAEAACAVGLNTVHVAFPFFMPLAKGDVDRFWDDLATSVPEARWVHYAHPRCGPPLGGKDYQRLLERHPRQFIGTKLTTSDVIGLSEIIGRTPNLAHFVGDRTLLAGTLLGARGCYSYWANTLPTWHRTLWTACKERRWEKAAAMQAKLETWEQGPMQRLRDAGYRHSAMAKARIALTAWLEDVPVSRAPYSPVAPALQAELQRDFDRYWGVELRREKFATKR